MERDGGEGGGEARKGVNEDKPSGIRRGRKVDLSDAVKVITAMKHCLVFLI